MKKLALAISIATLSGAASAASVTTGVTGYWNAMNTWNPGQSGDNTIATTPDGGPEMYVTGTMTYDDITGEVTSLSLTQVGDSTQAWDAGYDTVTMSGFAWTSSGTDLRLDSGTVVCNGADCGPGYNFGGNYIGTGGPLASFGPPYALTDWIGGDSFDTNGDTVGGDILDGPGFEGTVNLIDGTVAVHTLTTWDGFVPLAATGRYDLTVVPVPAAAWLFGSALLGLVGFKKRQR